MRVPLVLVRFGTTCTDNGPGGVGRSHRRAAVVFIDVDVDVVVVVDVTASVTIVNAHRVVSLGATIYLRVRACASPRILCPFRLAIARVLYGAVVSQSVSPAKEQKETGGE